MLSKTVIYYGKDEPPPERRALRAGPLSLIYEDGDLRYIRLGNREIVRRLYVAVRDHNWGTIPAVLSNVRIEAGADAFQIAYDAEHKQGPIYFFWHAEITGDPTGKITFTMDGAARSTFRRNRIGFCALHPVAECAGEPCVVEHADGSVEHGAFPGYIAPDQPFEEMRAITHDVLPGVSAEVRFAGDIFEMEDQRNWTDASFKTYCTPLRLPYPVEVAAGTPVRQSVSLTLHGDVPDGHVEQSGTSVVFTVGQEAGRKMPALGLQLASHGQPLSEQEIQRLKAVNLAYLRADLQLGRPDYPNVLRQANAEARKLGVVLDLALFLSDAAAEELTALARLLEEVQPVVRTFWIFSTSEKSTSRRWIDLARDHLAGYAPALDFGAGTNAYFTELNRKRPPIDALEAVTYSINPQVHAFDNASLVENLAAQASTVESARQFCADLPLTVGPITFRPRFNADATGTESEAALDTLPAAVDARQMSLFGAGWTLGSLKYLGESGVESATYYETTGWRGTMELEGGPPQPDLFPSLPGAVFPLYHVLADAGEFAGGEVFPSTSSAPLAVEGLTLRKAGRRRILLTNLSPEPQHVALHGTGERVRLRILDETSAEDAMLTPEQFREEQGAERRAVDGKLEVDLLPYAIARIDEIEGGDV